jgi:hypothetical protein
MRGAYRDRHDTWSAGCGGRKAAQRDCRADERCLADGKIVWSWRPWAGAKVTGDDPANNGDQKVMDTGESAKISVNTIAQGMSMFRLHL